MRLACIDIGSNTTRLLVAEPDGDRLRPIQGWRAFTRPGDGWTAGGALPAAVVAALAAEVAHQTRIADAAGAERIRVVATAVVRDAANRQELLDAIAAACGAEVEVLSHEREARLAFLGASRTLPHPPAGPVAVADVGGGSTELAVGAADGGAEWWASLPLGSATVTERWLVADPPTGEQVRTARAGLAEACAGIGPPPAEVAIAVGGSAVTLGSMAGGEIDAHSLGRLLATVQEAPSAEVARRHGLHPLRARVLPGGVLLLEWALQAFGRPLRVGAGGIREGVILEELARG